MTSDMLSPDELAAIARSIRAGGVPSQEKLSDLLRHIEALQQERDRMREVALKHSRNDAKMHEHAIEQRKLAEAAQKRAEGLRTALEEQWEAAHAEHCRNEWPHDGHCTWPRPAVLEG